MLTKSVLSVANARVFVLRQEAVLFLGCFCND